ncbi:MAG: phosphoribosylglycinamide formyltransferase [Treponema sp.]|jgi:phosphoribosylglycinamide formyltransferase-1|nr:phosphoribosylglycinamide formyltransferase [Treponema sp.]
MLALVSGGGGNLQALIDAERAGRFAPPGVPAYGRIAAVISDRAAVFALQRARAAGIPALVEAPDKKLPLPARRRELSDRILGIARNYGAGLIVLAGFLSILAGAILAEYEGRIINLHPALLPRYGGAGMYGDKVHAAVLAAGESESGCTVHLVDAGTDTGPVLLQRRVGVQAGDTVETLAERIHHEEHIAIVEAAALMIQRLSTRGNAWAEKNAR